MEANRKQAFIRPVVASNPTLLRSMHPVTLKSPGYILIPCRDPADFNQPQSQVAGLKKRMKDQPEPKTPYSPVDVRHREVDSCINIENQSPPSVFQELECTQAVRAPDPMEVASGEQPRDNISNLQTTTRYTYNFSLARRNLEAMGIIGGIPDGRPQEIADQQPNNVLPCRHADPLWSIEREEAFRLARVYEEEIGPQYPFLNPVRLIRLVGDIMSVLEGGARYGFRNVALPGPESIDPNDIQIVKLVLAIASIIETSGVPVLATKLSSSVQDSMQSDLWAPVKIGKVETYTLFVRLLPYFRHFTDLTVPYRQFTHSYLTMTCWPGALLESRLAGVLSLG